LGEQKLIATIFAFIAVAKRLFLYKNMDMEYEWSTPDGQLLTINQE